MSADFVTVRDGRTSLYQSIDNKTGFMARGETPEEAEETLRGYIAEAERVANEQPPLPPDAPAEMDEEDRKTYDNIAKALQKAHGQIREAARLLEVKTATFHSLLLPRRPYGILRGYAGDLREFWFGIRSGRMPVLTSRERMRVIQAWEKSGRSPTKTARELGLGYSTALDHLNRMRVPGAPPSPRFHADGSARTYEKKGEQA